MLLRGVVLTYVSLSPSKSRRDVHAAAARHLAAVWRFGLVTWTSAVVFPVRVELAAGGSSGGHSLAR